MKDLACITKPTQGRAPVCRLGAAVLSALAIGAPPVVAQTWSGGAGDWFDGANWDTATAPVASGAVVVSNGGTARLDPLAPGGAAATPLLSSLNVGRAGNGTGAGTVISDGVELMTAGLWVGAANSTAASFADGLVDTTLAGVSTQRAYIGHLFNQGVASSASGQVMVDGLYQHQGAALEVAQLFNSARGSFASGQLVARQISGAVGGPYLLVGNVSSNSVANVGNRSTGEVVASEGGVLTLNAGVNTLVGTTFGLDRASDASGTYLNEATGTLRLAGTLATAGDQGNLLVGRVFGGRADGRMEIGTLAMGTDRFGDVAIGTSTADGVAKGRVVIGGGDLRHSGALRVGQTTGGQAEGELALGGALRGGGADAALIGSGNGSGGRVLNASGSVSAAGGVAGYGSFYLGTLTGDVGAGSTANGRLVGGADAGSANVDGAFVGRAFDTGAASTADGELRLAGSLGLADGLFEVGQVFAAAAGTSVQGVVELGGDLGSLRAGSYLIVGNVTSNGDATVGNRSRAELTATGGTTLGAGTHVIVGTTFGNDRVVDAAGARVNEATGLMRLGGTLATSGDAGSLQVGRGFAGKVDGSLELGALAMGGDRFASVSIGTSTSGEARGRVAIGGGALRAGQLAIGNSTGGTAQGSLVLHGTDLFADAVYAGQGTGVGTIELRDNQAHIGTDVNLNSGLLLLDRSLMTVGAHFQLGGGATLQLDVDGHARGIEYGAINTWQASLDGELALDLGALVYDGDSMVFDLIMADDAIAGDFATFRFSGLNAGYHATTGVFDFGDGEVYRLLLTRAAVPEPATLALVVGALLALGQRRLRRRRGHGPGTIGR